MLGETVIIVENRRGKYTFGWEQYWTSPGDNTPRDTNYNATCLPSRKLYK